MEDYDNKVKTVSNKIITKIQAINHITIIVGMVPLFFFKHLY
jgi:hypothetical protein